MSKYTQGPWTSGDDGGHYAVILPDNRIAAYCGEVGAVDDEESIANARLIAAAPELLTALDLFANLDKHVNSDLWLINQEYCNQARAAIAKALGESA
jgi:hypothetical protein